MGFIVVSSLAFLLLVEIGLLAVTFVLALRSRNSSVFAAVFLFLCFAFGLDADKLTNRTDRCEGVRGLGGDVGVLRDADPGEGPTNFSFAAYTVTPSNESFAAEWPEWMLPYGSRIELHEKLFSLTNDWTPIREYVVEPGQTNLCDTLSLTNGHPGIAFKALYGDSLSITFPSLSTVVGSATGRRVSVAVVTDSSDPVTLPVAVDRTERPAEFPPSDPIFAADPFAYVDGLVYDPTNETVTADGTGAFTLATGDQLFLIAPKLSFGSPHSYSGEGLRSGSSPGSMRGGNRDGDQHTIVSPYPLDEPCLWEGWHEGTDTVHGCSCRAELDLGCDISSCTDIVCEVTVEDDTAVARVLLGDLLVWSNSYAHAEHDSSGGRSDYLSSDGCSSCGSCADGDCDAFDGPSAGSVRFRVSLGSPSEGHVSGFLWFDRDSVFRPTPSSFSLLARSDAHVTDSTAGGTRTVACSDRGGRTIAVSPIQDGVRLSVTFTATGAPDRTWEVTRDSGAMRFRKFNAGGVLMSDASYAPSCDTWAVTDNVSGITEVKASTGDVLSWENGFSRTVETVSACGAVTGSHVRVVSEVVGWGDYAVLRETERSEKCAGGAWRTSRATYWDDYGSRRNGQPCLVWGDDRAWSWTDYDELGRETFRLDQRDGSAAPEEWEWFSMEYLPGCDAFATVTDYEPHPGDSCHTNDWDKARTVSRYVVSDCTATLIARTWTRYARAVAANGWPTVAETTIRACSQSAGIDDPGNAVSTVVRYDDETSAVPYLLRGETISETDEDGVIETHCHTVLSNSIVRTVVSRTKEGCEAKTRDVTERDLAYGLTLYEATQLTADPGVEFGWRRHVYDSRNRLRFTQYDDGSSETNAYDCCRLLFRIDRSGAKTLYCSTPETAHLYHAEEEVYLSQLPRGNDYYYVGGNIAAFDNAFRVTQHYMDAFGRETNTVVRSDTVQWASTNASSTTTRWYRTAERNCWPDGVSGLSERTGARGLTTTSRGHSTQACDVAVSEERLPGAEVPDAVTTNVSFRGGGSISVRVASGRVAANRAFSTYCADGTRRDYSVTESDDCGVVTNSAASFDFLGRTVLLHTPVSCVSNVYEGTTLRVLYSADLASGVVATNLYDEAGCRVGEVSRGVAAESRTRYEPSDGEWWRVEAQSVSRGAETNSLSEAWTQLTGLSDSLRSRTRTYADGILLGTSETSFDPETLDLTETSVSASGGMSVRKSRFGRTVEEATDAGTKWTYYDFFGWPFYVKRAQPGENALKHRLYGYSDHGDMTDEGEFVSGSLGTVRWRAYGYDARGNRLVATNETGNVVTRTYDAEGRVLSEGGDTYPLLFGYDSSGHRTSMTTFRDGGGPQSPAAEGDTTAWAFDAATGLCTAKTYADGSSATNTWTADGLPLRAVNPDESWTEKVYDSNRRCVGQTSSDPSCGYGLSLDAFGRTVAASNDVARYVYALAHSGIATNETATAGTMSLNIRREADPYGRVVSLTRDGVEDSIFYNPTNGTVAAISNAEACVMYAYTSDLLDGGHTLTLADGARFTRTLVRGSNYQRGNVSSVVNVSPLSTNTFAYTYDALNRPVSRNSDAFAYNARGEVASATVDACSAAYAYDGIGNLLETSVATGGLTADATYYDANALNQYYSIWSPDDSSWIEHSTNGELTRLDDRGFLYDAKSRLVSVGEWVFDEERYLADDYDYYDELYSFEPIVSNSYDHLDRRVHKITPKATHTYFYDGWMLIKEIVASTNGTTDVIEYHWGKDLSGTIGGAGGVGGLLYLSISNSSTPQLYIPWYDAYGNIMGYWDAQGNVVAEYTYDAFGKLVSSSGPMAEVFSFRYSTKYFDPETGFYYYGYRFYSPELMRWITRDPIGEDGGVNLYAMCGNNPIVSFDKLGLARMLTRALVTSTDVWGLGGEKEARDILRFLKKLTDTKDRSGNKLYDVEIKDLAIAPFSSVRADVDKYGSDVYFIAHGTVEVNGKRYYAGETYVRKRGDDVIAMYDVNNAGRMLKLDTLGQKLNRENTFGCFVSPRVTKYDGQNRLTYAVADDFRAMYTAMLSRLKDEYSSSQTTCRRKIIVYEGEAGLSEMTTSEGLWYGPVRDEKFYKEIIDEHFKNMQNH